LYDIRQNLAYSEVILAYIFQCRVVIIAETLQGTNKQNKWRTESAALNSSPAINQYQNKPV